MKEFLKYFLGAGTEVEFTNFSLAHFLPILVMVGVILAIRQFRDKIRNYEKEKNLRYILAFLLILSEMSYYWRLVAIPSLGPNPVDHLPIPSAAGWWYFPAICSSARPSPCLIFAISGCSPALFSRC